MTIGGIIAALVTPYNGYGGIDTDGVGRLVERAVAGGAQGVLVNSPVGEGPHLSRGERIFVVEAAVGAAAGRLPVYAGTGAASTEETLALTWDAGQAGVAAAFVATPAYYPLPQGALLDHYRYLARRARLPIVPVGDPAAVGNTLEPPALAALAAIAGIAAVALRADDAGPLRAARDALGEMPPLIAASDADLPAALRLGVAAAASAVAGIVPAEVVALWQTIRADDATAAEALWARLRPLAALLDDRATGVAAAKAAATLLGLPGGAPRSPLPGVSDDLRDAVAAALRLAQGVDAAGAGGGG